MISKHITGRGESALHIIGKLHWDKNNSKQKEHHERWKCIGYVLRRGMFM